MQTALFEKKKRRGYIRIPRDVPLIVCNGGGVNSYAHVIALKRKGIIPDVITFADLEAEKPETYAALAILDDWLESVGFPRTTVCKKVTLPETPYDTLEGNCVSNETLPSLAFGMKSCSIKWKQGPQDHYIMGCKAPHNKIDPHPLWLECQERGIKPIKLIGYDSGRADIRRSKNLKSQDANFRYRYPLQQLGWDRGDCVKAIVEEGLPVPIKSACYFCPASKQWEMFWLAAKHPDLFMRALNMEYVALTGHHSRYDEIEFGASWEDMVRNADSFPSTNTTVGLGRKVAWNQWARVNGITDRGGNFIGNRKELLERATALNEEADNALDSRTC